MLRLIVNKNWPVIPSKKIVLTSATLDSQYRFQLIPYRCYSYSEAPSKSRRNAIITILSLATLGTGTFIAYLLYDPGLRKWIEKEYPASQPIIKFLLKENNGVLRSLLANNADARKADIVEKPKPKQSKEDESLKQKATATAAQNVAKNDKEASAKKSSDAKKEPDAKKEVKKVIESQRVDANELKGNTSLAAKEAIVAYNKAREALKAYRENVAQQIEQWTSKDEREMPMKIIEMHEQKESLLASLEASARKAENTLEKLRSNLDKVDEINKEDVKNNFNEWNLKVDEIRDLYEKDLTSAELTHKYWAKLKESRDNLSRTLGATFPDWSSNCLNDVSDEELELFVLYAAKLIKLYQQELIKIETEGSALIDRLLEKYKEAEPSSPIREVIQMELNNEKRKLAERLLKHELKIKLDHEKELKRLLKLQSEVNQDIVGDVIGLKNKEAERLIEHQYNQKSDRVKSEYAAKLAKLTAHMKALDLAVKERADTDRRAQCSQILWNSCQSLLMALQVNPPNYSLNEEMKPLQPEISAIKKAAVENDPIVNAVIASIPTVAKTRGVYSEWKLRQRFLNVEKVAHRLANIEEERVTLTSLFWSYLQSFLIINPSSPIADDEINNQPVIDVDKLNNYDVLGKARYWLDRGDFQQALQYMNLLKGASRAIADDWIKETRVFLETRQAANVLLSYAVYSSLIVQNGS